MTGSGESTSTGGGTLVPGYENVRRIGRGGFAIVYLAVQSSLGRDVAVKVLLTDLADEAEQRRFTNECQVLGRLGRHRNVVDTYDAGVTADDRPYIVMKYYPQGSLAQRVRDHGALPPAEVASIGAKLARALQSAHDIGVVHRDVKPDNILVDDDGEPVLGDFGVAAVADAAGKYTSSMAFSRAHVAPEVLDRNAFSPASDVYGLGSTLYTLLTGVEPFRAPSEMRQAMAILNDPPPPIEVPGTPPALAEAILAAMAKDPADRPASAEAFARLLETVGHAHVLRVDSALGVTHGGFAAEPAVAASSDGAEVAEEPTRRKPGTFPNSSSPGHGEPRGVEAKPLTPDPLDRKVVRERVTSRSAVGTASRIGVADSESSQRSTVPGTMLDEKPSLRRSPVFWFGAAVAGLVVFGVVVLVARLLLSETEAQPKSTLPSTTSSSADTSMVPDVVSMDESRARRTLTGAGLLVQTWYVKDGVEPPGKVLAQAPVAGTSTKRGTLVTITIASAP